MLLTEFINVKDESMVSIHRMTEAEFKAMTMLELEESKRISPADEESEAVLRLHVQNTADLIETTFYGKLVPHPAGVYRLGVLEPIMRTGMSYYYREGTETMPVTSQNINALTKAIYDENNVCVISHTYMQNKDKFLSNSPMLPYRGSHIVHAVLHCQLMACLAYYVDKPNSEADMATLFHGCVDQHFLSKDYDLNLILDCCAPLIKEMLAFFDDKIWNLYTIRLLNTVLIIERGMDWRAKEWEMKHGFDFHSGKYR